MIDGILTKFFSIFRLIKMNQKRRKFGILGQSSLL